ncbi:alpha/beta fold hydrolase [Marinitenerispora sediminis]|uniref:Alpha/beta hydrolase n=1 Tax=Marinitenerispora sediminis TaxID=1931232 RepID=A0A368T048_9ACTN|nr:alpha/beta hydrolase [Marinitenerispora sediminis]RCV52272.1 alpha/beta hydrolase [Marinitenerispora sediminis]RCV54973.1 alpha/beta hydrolase [Marinitenerispora sediminis]RCV59991.1 alpha/beta hydrolase [Marinitenerispora sediminis]
MTSRGRGRVESPGGIGRFTSPAARARFEYHYGKALDGLPERAGLHNIVTRFGRVRVYRFGAGEGPPLVLLHGTGGTSAMWRPNIAALAARRQVYAVDLLGEAGGSEQTAPIRSAADRAAWLAEALERLEIERAHLVGVSIGGWSAVNQAVHAPERVASISLLDPIQTFARMSLGLVLRTVPTVVPLTASWALPRFLRWIDGQGVAPEGDPTGEVIAAALRCYRTALPAPALFTDDQLRGISVRALALIAGRSVVHDPRRAIERARALVPDVQAELWPDATHAISGQCAAEVNARVLRFVDEVDGRGGPGH